MEERLKKDTISYCKAICHKQRALTGLNLLLKDVDAFSQAQAAWKFYNNPLIQNLKTQSRVYSNYSDSIELHKTHLEELSERSRYIQTLPLSMSMKRKF